MKKVIFFICIILVSCKSNNVSSNTTVFNAKPYSIVSTIDSIIQTYPIALENPIQKEKLLNQCYKTIITDISYIEEVPFRLEEISKIGNKYGVRFEAGKYTTEDESLNYYPNRISIAIYGFVNKEIAENLQIHKRYYITGKYILNNTLKTNNYVYKYNWDYSKDVLFDNYKNFDIRIALSNIKVL